MDKLILTNKKLTDDDFMFLCWLKYFEIKQGKENKSFINTVNISYELYDNINDVNKRYKKRFNDSMERLSNLGLISITHSSSSKGYLVDTSKLNYKESAEYVIIRLSDMVSILSLSYKDGISTSSLFRYFCIMLSMFRSSVTIGVNKWSKCPVGFFKVDDITDEADIHINTAYKYNSILEKIKMIYVYRTNDTYVNEDIETDEKYVEHISNTYGRYENKEYVMEVAIKHRNEYSIESNKKLKRNLAVVKANENRSLSTKYRWFCKDNNKYEYNEIKQLYLGLKEMNKKRAENNRKDLTVFKEYDFYNEEKTN